MSATSTGDMMDLRWQRFWIRDWQPGDRQLAAAIIKQVLLEYGLPWEPEGADAEIFQIEDFYWQRGGEFWVIEQDGVLVGTAAYQPLQRDQSAVEIRKMYLLPAVRGKGLGKYLLQKLEQAIAAKGYQSICIETASILKEAVQLYENNGYQPITEIETARCDLAYIKHLSDVKNS
ncbi:MAG: GNAT family N-acetyltransferase [Limnothrix sp.]